MRNTLKRLLVVAALGVAATARGDWKPGDPYKMHYPQLPDPNGWDVNFTSPYMVADDWKCTETGPVSDIHFWLSVKGDTSTAPKPPAINSINVSIHKDVPAVAGTYPFSHPGEVLWQRTFSPITAPQAWISGPFPGEQGWMESPTLSARPDHLWYYQLNLMNIVDPFSQVAGNIYWLDLGVTVPQGSPPLGWKTSIDHFLDNAVWGNEMPPIPWEPILDPLTGRSLDMAFVITPEPASLGTLGMAVGGLLGLRRRR